jgi:hypothetical protein
MSEANMTSLVLKSTTGEVAYETTFLDALEPALPDIARYAIKIAVNAGGSDVRGLCEATRRMVAGKGLKLKVASVEGDDVLELVRERLAGVKEGSKWSRIRNLKMKSGRVKGLNVFDAWMEGEEIGDEVRDYLRSHEFENLCTGEKLAEWDFKDDIIGAQAYLGGLGIARALEEGADIVICGRVSDASPAIGAAVWWHGWRREDLKELASAFVAGHLIECSTYVCGGNFTGFKELEKGNNSWFDIGYPIAEIGKKGELVITKQKGTGGLITVDTCKAQLLYEIQGPWYFNSDVTAVIDELAFEQLGYNRVVVTGIKAEPPPPTTKVGITAKGGFQAEVHWFLVGLDIEDKARMMEAQIRHALGDLSKFHVLNFTLNGVAGENAMDQNAATVDFRVFAQARKSEDIAPGKFLKPVIDLIMASYPGGQFHLDFRQGIPKPVQEYFVTLLPQSDIHHVVRMHDGSPLDIAPPTITRTFPKRQPNRDTSLVPAWNSGQTVRGPLGWLVHARSGDKGSNANVGFWVRHRDEYDWLRWLLSTERLKELLGKEYTGKDIVSRYSTVSEAY